MALVYAAAADADDERLQQPAFPLGDDAEEPSDAASQAAPPADGLEYLRRVRRQARQLPDVVRAEPPPPEDGPASDPALRPTVAALARPLPPSPAAWVPSRDWEDELLADFRALSSRLATIAPGAVLAAGDASPPAMPAISDAEAWQAFCVGPPADGGGGGGGGGGEWPRLSAVCRLEQRAAVVVLQALHARLSRDAALSQPLARWMYALMLRLEPVLPAESAAALRALLRTCAEMRASLVGGASGAGAASGAGPAAEEEAAVVEQAAALSTIICIAGRHFGQASEEELAAVAGAEEQ